MKGAGPATGSRAFFNRLRNGDEIARLESTGDGFRVETMDGAHVHGRRVVIATGLRYFAYIPQVLTALPPDLVTHTSGIASFGAFKGKEVADVLGDRNFPSVDVKLLDDDETLGQLESLGDEVTFIQNVRAEQFENIDFTFFASDQECTRKNWKTARQAGSALVDLSYALEDEADAVVRSPWVERQLGQVIRPELQPGPSVVAHPASVVLALLLLRAEKAGKIRSAVATVFEPVSEHGQKGMDELHEQTVNLLSFQPLPKNVFDAQVAFNMVARYGEHSLPPWEWSSNAY